MTRVFGGNADFSLNGVQIEPWLDSVTLNANVPIGNITSFGDTFENVVAGKKNITYELAGSWDGATGTADEVIWGCWGAGVKPSRFEPAGATTCVYTCTASGLVGTLVSSYSISLPVGDKSSFTASLQNSGTTTRET